MRRVPYIDNVDISLPVVAITTSFGQYLKYCVSITSSTEPLPSGQMPENNIDLTVLSSILHPVPQRTMKDRLFNDILSFISSLNTTIRETEVSTVKKLVIVLRDIFWHIDRHHHVFEQRAQPIPSGFTCFSNYNCPERSKHRKRLTSNMSSDSLQDFSLELSTILQFSFWDRPGWAELKPDVNSLLLSLYSYSDYLVQKNKRIKSDHHSPTPIREFSEHLQLEYISSTSSQLVPPNLMAIDEYMINQELYEATHISTLLPSNCVQKHRVVNCLVSNGLSSLCILLIYSPGSNVGNLNFLWKVPSDADIAECFERSQPIVEQTKLKLPVFHSRAMRSALYKKFGRVSPGVKPAVLRYFYKDLTGKEIIKVVPS